MDVDKRAYWIWLQHAFGEGSPMPWRIHRSLPGGVEEFFQNGPRLWNSLEVIREKDAAALYSFSLEEAQAQLEYALKVGWQVLTPESENYPIALKNIFDPPAVLYGKGRLPNVDLHPAIAVVGARKAKKESVEKGKEFGYQLAIGGAIVITGGAVGIDAAVTLGAMSGEGPIVSVLPVALNSPYVSQNAFLRESIVEKGGALVSEYFSQQSPGYGTFQARNRLVTGLSCGVLLIQAARKSGTSMYATHAKNQNRDVFVCPGPKDDPAFAGGWDLIADGAKAVECGEDIFRRIPQPLPQVSPGDPSVRERTGNPCRGGRNAPRFGGFGNVPAFRGTGKPVERVDPGTAVRCPAGGRHRIFPGETAGDVDGAGTFGSGGILSWKAVSPWDCPESQRKGTGCFFSRADHERGTGPGFGRFGPNNPVHLPVGGAHGADRGEAFERPDRTGADGIGPILPGEAVSPGVSL